MEAKRSIRSPGENDGRDVPRRSESSLGDTGDPETRRFVDVYAIEATDTLNLTRIIWGLKSGEFVEDECVHYWRTRQAWISTEPQLPINLDGELIGKTPGRFSVAPEALKVLVSRASRATLGSEDSLPSTVTAAHR